MISGKILRDAIISGAVPLQQRTVRPEKHRVKINPGTELRNGTACEFRPVRYFHPIGK